MEITRSLCWRVLSAAEMGKELLRVHRVNREMSGPSVVSTAEFGVGGCPTLHSGPYTGRWAGVLGLWAFLMCLFSQPQQRSPLPSFGVVRFPVFRAFLQQASVGVHVNIPSHLHMRGEKKDEALSVWGRGSTRLSRVYKCQQAVGGGTRATCRCSSLLRARSSPCTPADCSLSLPRPMCGLHVRVGVL